MIVFDLRCTGGHVFEAWFASSDAFVEQRDRRLVACSMCGDTQIDKAVMAPNVAAKGNRSTAPEAAKAMLASLAVAQATVLSDSRWVGRRFADVARAIHTGDEPDGTIHGQATAAEVTALAEEGITVAPLPLPVTPPDTLN